MLQRQQFLSTADFCDRKRSVATNGDMVSMHFEITPLHEARSVKAIFDALQTFVYNIEISISEAVGDITVRENDDAKPDSPVAQHRLHTLIQNVVQIEANNVAFAAYDPAGQGGRELGLSVCDAVDEDDLFPYRLLERMRQDMTMIIQLESSEDESGMPFVALTRWWCLRIRKSGIYVPPFAVERII
ncbi:hypothetical protein PHYSODRAFT_262033 [Phytophthora sojae]|uniref:Uncharacterized protein n=1 Tax=Phytophthora sojae (strain P6497) TaxID=1094619 RepID=G4ZYK4_PHYSP|nr:hypothetical protein PHYSODRAFT_262033 [Phytophthora sojae]EGZ12037.1 hypothetical protein PHYSODRAFT_262033 [Phytophthora sojae]|eukprot:XP_009532370.1 hypothetical protein PHYSODRAFT_262033 [Phytophthora sojae]